LVTSDGHEFSEIPIRYLGSIYGKGIEIDLALGPISPGAFILAH
jgi:hypothetical protein